jgi:tRNA modification GTPase
MSSSSKSPNAAGWLSPGKRKNKKSPAGLFLYPETGETKMNGTKNTIVAPATAAGGSIAVVRLSGEDAVDIAASVFRGKDLRELKGYSAAYGKIIDAEGSVIDEAVAVVYRKPHSYTGENSVEISCHGTPVAVEAVMERLLEAGARMAEPGEFTRRAFLNGKLDLIQAESVAEVVAADSRAAYSNASKQLRGVLSRKIENLVAGLKAIAGHLELELDFTEEDISFVNRERITADITSVENELRELRRNFRYARILKEGVKLAIVGKPNVGKSSLLNALLKRERAIISSIPGTTRDTVEEQIHFGKILVKIIDTAGIRKNPGHIEKIGLEKTRAAINAADYIFFVFDVSAGLDKEDEEIIKEYFSGKAEKPGVVVGNKADLPPDPETESRLSGLKREYFKVSAERGEGVTDLAFHVEHYFLENMSPGGEEITVTNLRQQEAVNEALNHLEAAKNALSSGAGNEIAADDIRRAVSALEIILGRVSSEDVLNAVFASFCVGK